MFGKPHEPIYDAALARIAALRGAQAKPARVLAIGGGATEVMLEEVAKRY